MGEVPGKPMRDEGGPPMIRGYLLFYSPNRRYGFARPDDSDGTKEGNAFVHESALDGTIDQYVPGVRVEMVLIPPQGKNRRAIKMRLLENGQGEGP